MMNKPIMWVALAAAGLIGSAQAALDPDSAHEVEDLLKRMGQSGCTFVHNGDAHTAKEAVAHLRLKLEKAGHRLRTTEDFIDQLASKSNLTGRPYLLRCVGLPEMQSARWLRAELKWMRHRSAAE
ncbi:hypothetical protein HNQ59_002166 [Chitinivorax tropicus]|uniref:DUF5329 domain-containing protein n=1 Tax=Chitinivorax tropicus TaxID=714531 RepID=A0A840MP56_9PROT|nr:DUF5329 family protein [Chitinivorax tropicus]MBB5018869.1 hypothetical protein [Chitinivorax tropicus]